MMQELIVYRKRQMTNMFSVSSHYPDQEKAGSGVVLN